MEEDEAIECCTSCPNDWMEKPELLPERPKSLLIERFKLLFALDVQGKSQHDMYVAISPNQVCMVGIAPSHPLIQQHRRPSPFTEIAKSEAVSCSKAESVENLVFSTEGGEASLKSTAEGTLGPESAERRGQAIDGELCSNEEYQMPELKRQCIGEEKTDIGSSGVVGSAPSARVNVDHFPLDWLKAVVFDQDSRKASRLNIKECGRSGKKRQSEVVLQPNSFLCRLESTLGERYEEGQCIHCHPLSSNTSL